MCLIKMHVHVYETFLWFLLILGVHSTSFLNFVPVDIALHDTFIHVTNRQPVVFLDATATRQRTVYFMQRSIFMQQKLTYFCHVSRQDKPLKSLSLCCQGSDSGSERTCNSISLDQAVGKITCFGTKFQYQSSVLTGANFSILIPKDVHLTSPLNGRFSCIVTNDAGESIESNDVLLRDVVYFLRQLNHETSTAIEVLPPLRSSDFPYTFKCTRDVDEEVSKKWPEWMNQIDVMYSPYEWSYCDVSGQWNALECVEKSVALSSEEAIKYINGTMYLINPQIFKNRNFALVCRLVDVKAACKTYAGEISESVVPKIKKGISIVEDDYTIESHVRPLSATFMNYTFIKGTILGEFNLKALYSEPSTKYKYQWYKNDQPITKSVTKFTLPLRSPVDESMAGRYTLVLSSIDSSQPLTFTFLVNVVSAPFFLAPSCIEGLVYVMEGDTYSSSCPFEAGADTTIHVGVSGVEATEVAELRRLIEEHYRYSNNPLSKLDITFQLLDRQEHKGCLTLNVNKLQPEQEFVLSVRLQSVYGQSHIYNALRTIPKPTLQVSPSAQNCIKDCDLQPYNVSCTLNSDLINLWKSKFGIQPTISWLIQNEWTTDNIDPRGLGQFMNTHGPINSVLTIWPDGKPKNGINENPSVIAETSSDELKEENDVEKQHNIGTNDGDKMDSPLPAMTLKQYIAQKLGGSEAIQPKDLTIQCWIRLIVFTNEAKFNSPINKASGLNRVRRQPLNLLASTSNNARLIYDSRWETDENLIKQLTTIRTFTPDAEPATASLAWITAVVIGIILVIAIIVLSVWLCTRDKGETYLVYDKERAHGNDPIQELKEKETFQTFQRQEEPPVASSRYSLNDGSMHIESEDDGELDEYADNFNEEASFVGQYSGRPIVPSAAPEASPELSATGLGAKDGSVDILLRNAQENQTAV